MCTTIYIYILAQPRNYLAIIRTTIKKESIFRFFHFKKQFVSLVILQCKISATIGDARIYRLQLRWPKGCDFDNSIRSLNRGDRTFFFPPPPSTPTTRNAPIVLRHTGGNNYYTAVDTWIDDLRKMMYQWCWQSRAENTTILVQLASVTSLIATLLSRTDLPGIATNHTELVIRCVIRRSLCPCFSTPLSMEISLPPNYPTRIRTHNFLRFLRIYLFFL